MVSLRSLIAGVALIAAPVMAAMEPADIKLTFNILEASAESLEEVAHRINPVNALSQLIRQGPLQDLLEGFAEMTSTTNDADAELEGSSPIPDGEEADDVFYALRDVRGVHIFLPCFSSLTGTSLFVGTKSSPTS
jgi:hypothetical protein